MAPVFHCSLVYFPKGELETTASATHRPTRTVAVTVARRAWTCIDSSDHRPCGCVEVQLELLTLIAGPAIMALS